ncbi:MAG: 6-phosphogluconolactonase [Verrucomicrobiales bacterium]|nr:6-phosphogluconolactonase [Verrucomicrobiales bacterium]
MDNAGVLFDASREIQPGVWVYRDAAEVVRAAAQQLVELAREFTGRDGKFAVALSGGKTPQLLYRRLASPEFRAHVDWSKVHLFWGDERPVPPDSIESNYGLAHREFLTHVPIPTGNVHRMEAERPDLDRAAREYEDVMRQHLDLDAQGWPRFHLILLGIGADGHTASLFPDAANLRDASRWVAASRVDKLGTRRMTLTLPVLNAAHNVTFLVAGEEKADAVRAVLEGGATPPLPAQLVVVPAGRRMFLLDRAAAGKLIPGADTRAVGSGERP